MPLPSFAEVALSEYRDGVLTEVSLPFSAEYAVLLKINGRPYITMASSGNYLREHVTGYLITEGIIAAADQIARLEISEDSLTVDAVLVEDGSSRKSSSGLKPFPPRGEDQETAARRGPGPHEPAAGAGRRYCGAMSEFLTYSREHDATHGVHSAALYSLAGRRLVFFDEIGRHNAIDKVIGYAAAGGISLEDKMICSTGRISSEIALKFINARAPVLVTRASPTTLSVALLRRYNILAVIRAVNGRFCVVNGREHILL